MTMNTEEIRILLSEDKRTADAFRGVFASDELPQENEINSLYICNTDPSHEPGEHWIVMYIDENRRADYFDSFGRYPTEKCFENFLDNNSVFWIHNDRPVQDLYSDACGYHYIFFSVHRCVGFDLNSIVNMYTDNLLANDAFVKRFVLRDVFIQ